MDRKRVKKFRRALAAARTEQLEREILGEFLIEFVKTPLKRRPMGRKVIAFVQDGDVVAEVGGVYLETQLLDKVRLLTDKPAIGVIILVDELEKVETDDGH